MFKPHIGNCISCPRKNVPIVVKKGWCDKCNYEIKKAKKYAVGGKPIKKELLKPKNTGQADVFLEIWQESNQRCSVCNKPIQYPIASNFAHILSKALNKYPLFKLYKKNIVLMCHDSEGSCHHRWDKEPRSSLSEPIWKPFFELEAELKEEYKQLKSNINDNRNIW